MEYYITVYPKTVRPTMKEVIIEVQRQQWEYVQKYGETNFVHPEILNALYSICYPKSHIQKLYERGELIWK